MNLFNTNIHSYGRFAAIIGLFLSTFYFAAFAHDKWSFKKEKQGIQVFTRNVDGSKYVEFKAESVFTMPSEKLVTALKQVDRYLEWVPNLKASKLLEQGEDYQIHYVITKLPFPLKDRDEIYKYTYQIIDANTIKVQMDGLPSYLPEERNMVRMPISNGHYLFEKVDATNTKVTLQMHTDPGGNLPAWAFNSKIVKVPFETLQALKKQSAN